MYFFTYCIKIDYPAIPIYDLLTIPPEFRQQNGTCHCGIETFRTVAMLKARYVQAAVYVFADTLAYAVGFAPYDKNGIIRKPLPVNRIPFLNQRTIDIKT